MAAAFQLPTGGASEYDVRPLQESGGSINPRLASQRAVYHPDGGAQADSKLSNFDGFGRVARELLDLPGGGQAERTSSWTAQGELAARSEWHATGAASGVTTFGLIDPFGRPGRIFLPDGTQIDLDYFGVGRRKVHVPVATGVDVAGEPILSTATTTEHYDRFGRLAELDEPNGTRTTYTYDALDELTEVTVNAGATPQQARSFGYDHRGFLTSESHPELGTDVLYSDHDPLGNPGRIRRGNDRTVEGGWDLRYSYDAAGRLTEIDEVYDVDGDPSTAGTGTRPWKEWSYATGNFQAGQWSNGKLASAVRHNHLLVPGTTDQPGPEDEVSIAVTESYRYDGVGGRISRVQTDVAVGGTPRFVYSLAYDPLGNVSSRTYPTCSDAEPFDADLQYCPQANTPRTVTQQHDQGLLTAIDGYAPSITYHPNGQVHTIVHANGVTGIQDRDPADMARPLRLRTTGASEDLDTGPFGYDGAGNVTKIGQSRFQYDLLSRLVAGETQMVADACSDAEDLSFLTFSDTRTFESCGPVSASATAVLAGGDVTFRSGERVILGDGFRVEAGGRFVAEVDPAIEPTGAVAEADWSGEYDLFGNLTGITTQRPGEAAITHTPLADPATNRLVAAGTAYDVAGNVIQRPGWSYSYDPFGMLRVANDHAFIYGPGDERIWTAYRPSLSVPSTWLDLWTLRDLDGAPLRQLRTEGGNGNGNWHFDHDYVWRGGTLLATELEPPGATQYLHPDPLGTPRLVTDAAGTTVAYHAYFPFGEEATSPTDATLPLQYTAHERDDLDPGASVAGDLDYMHARYFSAHLGRFLSTDPIVGSGFEPQSWNLYSYVLGNPVKYVDPRGEFAWEVAGQIGWDQLQCLANGGCEFINVTPSMQGRSYDPLTGVSGYFNLVQGSAFTLGLSGAIEGGATDDLELSFGERVLSAIPSDFAQTTGEAVVGFGDVVSFGLTDFYRDQAGLTNTIDEESGAYLTGEVAGVIHGIALGSAGAARAAGVQTRVALHEAHHAFGRLGRLRHFQLNIWRIGVKGSGRAFRLPLPWR